ncbi:MAG: peptidase T [Clostridia bacterium]|nr:peptidase T [Clostridia bacterium]
MKRSYERFIEYAAYHTTSSEETGVTPSTPGQLVLAERLSYELKALGLSDARVDEYGYVYASLPANVEGGNSIGLIAHMDTSDEASGENVKCNIVDYKGGDICLNPEKGIYMRVSDYPYLAELCGEHIITSDGTTLIGADDKAGIAEIMTALEIIITENLPHGKISIAFTPDEEIGEGADHFDVEAFGADYAYTVDGGALGELEYENFNAASAKVKINGVSIHPGSAKDKMKNAARIAAELAGLLTTDEIPEKTEGYEGFYHLLSIEGGCESASLSYIIRDHSMEKFFEKKAHFAATVEELNCKYGEGTVELTLTDSYFNMREKIEDNMFIVERARCAMEALGITPRVNPIRGGTDGARLSFMGLPCPNLCTGGYNFHSRFEFVSVEAMDRISSLLARIITDAVADGYREVKA